MFGQLLVNLFKGLELKNFIDFLTLKGKEVLHSSFSLLIRNFLQMNSCLTSVYLYSSELYKHLSKVPLRFIFLAYYL